MRKSKSIRTRRVTGFVFLAPALIFILYATVVPFVWNLVLSFQKWDGFSSITFRGIQNYLTVFKDPAILKSIGNSIYYALASTTGGILVGLMLATLVFKLAGKEGSFFRLVLFSPAMLPTAVVGLMFTFFYNPEMGLLNNFLKLIGLESLNHVWLQNKSTAMICIIFVAVWKCAGQVMLLCFASMQTIPGSLYESAMLDGASYWKQIRYITLPLIKPMILLATINTLGTQYKSYDLIFTMTQGGPGSLTTTVPINMTKMAFSYGKFGESAATGVIFTIVVMASILLAKRFLRGEEYEF
ncbi:sugar ABC transporter permease [Diplocloster hominis]|uniref:carbohydrate ABC transporter permease n=1 Tax=Diplocloster hominis TaxID=3079010 RepID=UPI0031B9CC58